MRVRSCPRFLHGKACFQCFEVENTAVCYVPGMEPGNGRSPHYCSHISSLSCVIYPMDPNATFGSPRYSSPFCEVPHANTGCSSGLAPLLIASPSSSSQMDMKHIPILRGTFIDHVRFFLLLEVQSGEAAARQHGTREPSPTRVPSTKDTKLTHITCRSDTF